MSNILTFTNEQSYFTIEGVDSSSKAVIALKDWATMHCSLKSSSEKGFVIENDTDKHVFLRACRMFAIKRNLKVSTIQPLKEAI